MPESGSVVLDTNVAIAHLSGDRAVQQHLAKSGPILIPTIVVGELLYGAQRSDRAEQNLQRVNELVSYSEVIDVTIETARNYGAIKTVLRRKGTPIPDNDIWIAAVALEHGAPVATRDEHFDAVENLTVLRW